MAWAVVSWWAQVGEPEDDQETLPQLVGFLHRVLQGVVGFGALGLLHPVQDLVALPNLCLI